MSRTVGIVFQLTCCSRLVILCVRGKARKFPLTFKGIYCRYCRATFKAQLATEPNWTHTDLPNCYPDMPDCKFQIMSSAYAEWLRRGRPREDDMKWDVDYTMPDGSKFILP